MLDNSMLMVDLMLAVGLSAAAGFRIFVPFFTLSLASTLGHLDLPQPLDWLETTPGLILLGFALLIEIISFSIPWFDHFVDIIATPMAMIAGILLTAAVTPEMDPMIRWSLAIIAGGGSAGATKSLMGIFRGTSTIVTGGFANPLLAFMELLAAIALSLLAITTPVIAGLIVVGLSGAATYRIGMLTRKILRPSPTPDMID